MMNMRTLVLAAILTVATGAAIAQVSNPPGIASGGAAGGDLGGTYPNPTVTNGSHIANGSIANSGLATPAPCSTFGTAAGTCAQGGTITAGGPTGSATIAPIITYNAAGQLTSVSSATITPAVGSVTGLGTGVATALGVNVGSAGAPVVNGGTMTGETLAGTTTLADGGTLTSSGNKFTANTGIGTTLSPWTLGTSLDIGSATGILGGSSALGYGSILGNNTYFSGGSWYAKVTGAGSYYVQQSGVHYWHTLASVTAGSVQTDNTVMSLSLAGVLTLNTANYNSCTALTTSSGVINCTASDARVKNDLGTITPEDGLAEVLSLHDPHRYTFKAGFGPSGVHTGNFAQEIQASGHGELVDVGRKTDLTPDGILQYNQDEQIAYLIAAVKALAGCKLSVAGNCWWR